MLYILIGIGTLLSLITLALIVVLLGRVSAGILPRLEGRLSSLDTAQVRIEQSVRDEMGRNREELTVFGKQSREEQSNSLHQFTETLLGRMVDIATLQKQQLETFSEQLNTLTQTNAHKLDSLKESVDNRLRDLQDDNSKKLEQMRLTVDEKLHATLEKRLGESFKLVSERLEQVHKGLGEMQTLATGVGDLKKVLVSVKMRGTFGEVQLGSLLEQVFSPDQYAANVSTKKGSSGRVEYAIKLPGRDSNAGNIVWLPIDAKFPLEDYQRLAEAQEQGDTGKVEEMSKQIEIRIKGMAKDIRDKYLDPPNTTDFGIMFLPTEGLYAEVLRRTGLVEVLQHEYRVTVAGPMTLGAILNSLQMGFRTLAIEKRSSEVWTVLGAVKTEFAQFGLVLEKTKKKLDEASNTIDTAAVRTRAIERKLRDVQAVPAAEACKELPSLEEQ